MSPHRAGLGDHRYCIYDLDAASILGAQFPTIHKPASRLLRMDVERNVCRFNKVMEQLVDQHRMFHKLSKINALAASAPLQVIKQAFNKWDDELTEQMKCAERKGCKLYRGKCEYSPILSYWYGRKRLWERACRHKLDPLRDPRNLYRELALHGFPKPSSMTLEFIEAKKSRPVYMSCLHLRPRPRHFANNTDALAAMVVGGLGYSLLARDMARSLLEEKLIASKGEASALVFALCWYRRPVMPSHWEDLVNRMC